MEEGFTDFGDGTIGVGIPPKSANPDWLITVLRGLERMDILIMNLTGPTDIRPILLARNLVMRIPKQEVRQPLIEAFDKEIDRINQIKNLDNETKGYLRITQAQNVQAPLMEFANEAIGIMEEVKIQKLVPPDDKQ